MRTSEVGAIACAHVFLVRTRRAALLPHNERKPTRGPTMIDAIRLLVVVVVVDVEE